MACQSRSLQHHITRVWNLGIQPFTSAVCWEFSISQQTVSHCKQSCWQFRSRSTV